MNCHVDSTAVELEIAKISAGIKTAPEHLRGPIQSVVENIGRDAASHAPVKTGTLRDSMTATTSVVGPAVIGKVEFGGLASAYASIQEDRYHFLGEASTAAPEEVVRAVERDLPRIVLEGR